MGSYLSGTRKAAVVIVSTIVLSACSSTMWNAKTTVDEFTDETRCKVSVGSDFGKDVAKSFGGIHYYPFIARAKDEIIFGIENDYNLPLGDAQVRVDDNAMIEISAADTPVILAPKQPTVDMSYLKGTPGLDSEALQKSVTDMTANIQKYSSPFRAVSGEKAREIIKQLLNGKSLKVRIIGVNQVNSTTGEWEMDGSLPNALAECGIDPNQLRVVTTSK